MKVGTDGTMLGCWVSLDHCDQVLDVGCGSGVLSIICAQKNAQAIITGIDVEQGAVLDAMENVDALQKEWRQRITILHSRLQDFIPPVQYDLIVSNPPFFENSQVSPDDKRNFARHTESLHYSEIILFAKEYLTSKGRIAMVLPYENGLEAIDFIKTSGFFIHRSCTVHPVPSKAPHRLLIEASKSPVEEIKEKLIIETGIKRHDYTEEYIRLGKDFYLYF